MVVAPVPGRLIVFGSGRENPHRVNIVNSGTRYVLSFWFTCDESRVFEHFLDGKMHQQYKARRKRKHKRKHRKKKENLVHKKQRMRLMVSLKEIPSCKGENWLREAGRMLD